MLATGGVALLSFGLVNAPGWGWASVRTVAALAGAAVLVGAFVAHCRTSRSPLVDPALFRSRHFTGASLIAIVFSTSFGVMLLSLALWEQGAWGWSALHAGLAIAPGPLMVPTVSSSSPDGSSPDTGQPW